MSVRLSMSIPAWFVAAPDAVTGCVICCCQRCTPCRTRLAGSARVASTMCVKNCRYRRPRHTAWPASTRCSRVDQAPDHDGPVTHVCIDGPCRAGSADVIASVTAAGGHVHESPCLGQCERPTAVFIQGRRGPDTVEARCRAICSTAARRCGPSPASSHGCCESEQPGQLPRTRGLCCVG